MLSVIRENQEEIEYPCLMIGIHMNAIVLFEKEKHGMVLNQNKIYRIGHYSDVWAMEEFKPFNGTIELSNNYNL